MNLIKTFLFTAVLFTANSIIAQDFQGMAVYESKTSKVGSKTEIEGNQDISPDTQKMIEEKMKKMFEKTFILNFDKSASIYKEEEKLDDPGQGQGGIRMMSLGGGGTYYKNVKDKSYVVNKELMGKEFLVKDSLLKLDWKLEGETKMIGEYKCFKAKAIRPISKTDFRTVGPKENAEKEKGTNATKKTNFMDAKVVPKEITITAWYTPEIPVNQGPDGYWGLPGLILEVNDGSTVTLCSKVVLNPKEKTEIKAPTNGKVVSQKEYDDTVMKKIEEMHENKGRGGNEVMQIRIEG